MSAPTESDVRAVLRRFGVVSVASLTPLGAAGGFSGAALWRVTTSADELSLKAWPPGRGDSATLRQIGELVSTARADHGLRFVPFMHGSPDFAVEHGGRWWELSEWLAGAADFRANRSPVRLASALASIAQLHRAWQPQATVGPCPAVERRRQAARDWLALVTTGWRPRFTDADPVARWAEHAWRVVCRDVRTVADAVQQWSQVIVPLQPCHGDLWHDHVLFSGDSVTGIIDFASVRVDSVAADLARLLGSLVGSDDDAFRVGVAAYERVRPLSEGERALVPLLDRTGVVLGLANWLRWLGHEDRPYPDRTAVARRIAALVSRAEAW